MDATCEYEGRWEDVPSLSQFSLQFPHPPTCSHPANVRERTREEREREPLSLASLRMTHRAAEKPSIHPATCFHIPPSHLSLPSSPARGKSHSWPRQLQNGAAQRRGIHSLSPLPQEALSWVAGRRRVSFSPSLASAGAVRSRRWMGRCEGCFVRVRLSGVVRSMTHPPFPTYSPFAFASPSSNAICKRLTKYITTIVQSASYRDQQWLL